MKIRIYDYEGTNEELQQLLTRGLMVQNVCKVPKGKGVYVEYEEKPKGGKPMKYDKEMIKELRKSQLSYGEIAKAIGCSKTYVINVCKEK